MGCACGEKKYVVIYPAGAELPAGVDPETRYDSAMAARIASGQVPGAYWAVAPPAPVETPAG